MIFNVALLQIMPGENLRENINIGISACKKAKKLGADIALFPEMFSSGYNIPQNEVELKAISVSVNSQYVNTFKTLAKELDMAIGITLLESSEPSPKNTVMIIDRFGKDVLTYAKVHTCDFGDERVLTSGDDFYVACLNTKGGDVKIGAMICYDREFPESCRILMLKGAEIVLVPNACPMEINRLSQLRGRAYENMVGIATCNYPAPKPDCNGHSSAFDGVAYCEDLPESRDTCILEANEEEGIYVAEFNMDFIRDYRQKEVHGNAYRRPEKYGLILEKRVEKPFIRTDKRG